MRVADDKDSDIMASLCAPPFPLVPQIFYSLFGKYRASEFFAVIFSYL